jgi:hypothetical protein
LAKHSIPMVPHLPYSPDLAPCNFFLFRGWSAPQRGNDFKTLQRYN